MTLAPSLRALVSFAATIVLAAIEPRRYAIKRSEESAAPGRHPKNEIPRCARNDKAFQITNYPITKLQISQLLNSPIKSLVVSHSRLHARLRFWPAPCAS